MVRRKKVDRLADTLLSPKLRTNVSRPCHIHSFVLTYEQKLPRSLRVQQSNGSTDGRSEPCFSTTLSLPFSSVKCHVIRRMEASTHFSLLRTILSMHVSRAAWSPRGTSAPPQSSRILNESGGISPTFLFPATDLRRGSQPAPDPGRDSL